MSIFNFDNPLKINAPVGNNRENQDEDVRTVRVGLETLGYFGESERERDVYNRPLGMATVQLDNKTRDFQQRENLKVDGYANPEGETITTMSKRVREKQLAVQSPPDYRREVFKGPRFQEWEGFNRKLENDSRFVPNERGILRDIYAAEGGMKKAPDSTAFAGILQSTLDRFVKKGYLEKLQKKHGKVLVNTDFDTDDVIEFYDRYFDDAMLSAKLGYESRNPGKTIRGLELLGKLDNKVGHAIADTFFKNGKGDAVGILHDALDQYNKRKTKRPDSDVSVGLGDYKMFKDIASDKNKSKAFLKILAEKRTALEKNSDKEKDRIEYYLNTLED